jgi:hypothetical protein
MARFLVRLRFLRIFLPLLLYSVGVFSENQQVQYVSFAEAAETLRMFSDSGLPGSDIVSPQSWDRWIHEQDQEVRSRINRGVEDSISNLILYGTSYTDLPRFENPESAVTAEGTLSEGARARVRALAKAARTATTNERTRIVQSFLRQKRIAADHAEGFLSQNLLRFAEEQRSYNKELDEAERSRDLDQKNLTRGTLYQSRGLSADTSLLVNYALEDTLRTLVDKGVIAEGKIRRIAIIGPGLDFTNKHNGYDFYPLQTIQPFAVMESVLRLKLGRPGDVAVVAMDLNPAVNAHMAKLHRDADAGRPYTLQLPRDTGADWPKGAVSYWAHFGEIIGVEAEPLPVPRMLQGGVALRAVSVAPRYALHVTPLDLNVVAQREQLRSEQAFDLVIATNILVYYDRFQQALAMANIAGMMKPGGVFLSNDALSSHHLARLRLLDRHIVSLSTNGPFGDNVLAYQLK